MPIWRNFGFPLMILAKRSGPPESPAHTSPLSGAWVQMMSVCPKEVSFSGHGATTVVSVRKPRSPSSVSSTSSFPVVPYPITWTSSP